MVRKNVIKEIGLFDPDYFMYYEETDFCWRMWIRGYKVVYVPLAIVYHLSGGSGRTGGAAGFYLFHREKNRVATMIKNYSNISLIRYLPITIGLQLMQGILYLYMKDRKKAIQIIRAIKWNIVNFKYTWVKHQNIQYTLRKVPEKIIVKSMMNINFRLLIQNYRLEM